MSTQGRPPMEEVFPQMLARGFQEEILVLSPELTILHANERFLQARSLGLDGVRHLPCHLLLESCRRFCEEFTGECPVHKAMSLDSPTTVTHRDVPLQDEVRHFKIHIYPVDWEGYGRCYLHITRDITDRIEQERLRDNMWMEILQQMEELYNEMVQEGNELDRLQRRFEHLKDNAPLAMVAWDAQGRIRQWNQNTEILLGWTAQETMGQPFGDFFASGESSSRIARIMESILQGQELDYSVNENRTASGDLIVCEWYHSALFAEGSRTVQGGLSMGQDITENVRTARALHRMESQSTALLQAVEDALVGVSHLGRITFWNEAAERLFGWSGESAVGREIEILLPPEAALEQGRELRRFFSNISGTGPQKLVLETQAAKRDGRPFPARLSLFAQRIGGEHIGVLAARDLSEAKRLERLLSQSEKMRSLGEMASGVAHDLNNHLTAVLGNLEILRQSSSEKAALSQIERVAKAAQRGVDRTAELQAYVRGDAEPRPPAFETSDLGALIREVVDLTRFRWKDQTERSGHTIDLVTDINELPQLRLNRSDMRELLTNLVLNAVEAMPRGGRLHISAGLAEEQVQLKVQDNGVGMSQREQSRAFEPFFTSKGSNHAGMGLSIARSIARRHGGELHISSIRGSGTTLTLLLPLSGASGASLQQDRNEPCACRILLIEDEEPIRDMLHRFLEGAGHEVLEASNGREGVSSFRQGGFDMVITDHGMPEMNGEEAALRIKKADPEIPILLISGWSRDLDRLEQQPGLFEEVLSKPLDLEGLLRAIQRLSARSPGKNRNAASSKRPNR